MDKLIAYRVLECGVLYEGHVSNQAALPDSVTRIAETMLTFRVDNAKTGQVLATFDAYGKARDKVSKQTLRVLQDMHYRHYGFAYPNAHENPEQSSYWVQDPKEKSGSMWGIVFGVLLATVGLIALATN